MTLSTLTTSASKAVLQHLPVEALHPHPQNPRLAYREDVLESIIAQLRERGFFSEEYAPLVRPLNGVHQIVVGHHRVEAAKRAALATMPCWVKEMSDEEAFMLLVLSNSQGELDPLEIGIHALEAVEKGSNRFTGAGLSQYADLLGKSQGYISQVRNAAQVYRSLDFSQLKSTELIGKAQHLAAIHKAPRELWPLLVERLLAGGWSVADTEYWISKVKAFDIPDKWGRVFLPLLSVIERFLDTQQFSPATVKKLVETAEQIEAIIQSYAHTVDVAAFVATFSGWLRINSGGESWDVRQLVAYRRKLVAQLEIAEMEAEKRWNCGDWREHVADLPDGGVALLLTDPPYGIGFQSGYKLDRREERNHDPIANDEGEELAARELTAMLEAFLPKLAADAHALVFTHWKTEPAMRAVLHSAGLKIRGSLIWDKDNTSMGALSTTFAPKHERIIHAVKGSPVLVQREADVISADRVNSSRHPTEKPVSLLMRLIEATTVEGELVADPFGGVASTLIAAKRLKREFWGCELSAEYHRLGLERLENGLDS